MGRAESTGADFSTKTVEILADEKSALSVQPGCWVCSRSGHCTPRWNCSCSPTYTWLCPVHSGASGKGVTPLLPHSVPTCGLHAEQDLHPSCTCVEPSLLQTSSLFQFLKANFSCAESRGKTPIDRKQVGSTAKAGMIQAQ